MVSVGLGKNPGLCRFPKTSRACRLRSHKSALGQLRGIGRFRNYAPNGGLENPLILALERVRMEYVFFYWSAILAPPKAPGTRIIWQVWRQGKRGAEAAWFP